MELNDSEIISAVIKLANDDGTECPNIGMKGHWIALRFIYASSIEERWVGAEHSSWLNSQAPTYS
jgi:hypothetical protein